MLNKVLIFGFVIVTLSACVYRMDVPQGNRIDGPVIDQLRLGMSRNQVEFLMGSPAVVDLYRADQWYYVYYLKTGEDRKIEKRQVKLTFEGDLLKSVEGAKQLN